ncbi:hypothetical protein ACFQX9_11820 [Bradyrhizobium sp. GCM10028915]|uniref:hypothetical protein n=1 Tax=Bradyrhizobium sp. GCM10028915 TaxID=3273385 RepID=UPI00360C5F11
MKVLLAVFSVSLVCAAAALAQSPYAGMQTRSIKALSDQQGTDLREGRGMGLALAAELNGYPGPSHVLELADRLGLTSAQRLRVQELFDTMKAEAVPVGARLLSQEATLDEQFASRTVNEETLKKSVAEIALTQGALRAIHLKHHLLVRTILDASN